MKINEVHDKVTVYDQHILINPKSAAAAIKNERMVNIFNANNYYDDDKSLISTLTKVSCLRSTEQRSDILTQKPVCSELISFGAEFFNTLKDYNLLDVTEPDQSANSQKDLKVLQNLRKDSKSTLKSRKFEQIESRRIEDIYSDIFKNASHMKKTIAAFVDNTRASPEDDSKANEKIHKKSLATSTPDWNALKVSETKNDAKEKEKQNTIINTEVTMSITTIATNTEGKKIMGRVESFDTNESLFFIKKNCEDDSETDIEIYTDTRRMETKQFIFNQLKLLKLEEDLKAVNFLQKKLQSVPQNRFFENIVHQDFEEVDERDKKSAGDTLETLSNSNDNTLNVDDAETTTFKRKENVLNDISMLQAALQKSKLVLDDINSPENATRDVSKKSSQKSIEDIKALQYDNESLSKGSVNVGETSYMRETKENAIPRNYENVSKHNKELMVASVMADKSVLMNPSMHSRNLQANLMSSSQEELDSELDSSSKSILDLDKLSSLLTVASTISKSESLKNMVAFPRDETHVPEQQPVVLIFDHLNPLNNILLRPINYSEAHKYSPMKGDEKLSDPKQNHYIDKNSNQVNKNYTTSRSRVFEVRTVTIEQNGFMPKTAQEAEQGIISSMTYSVDTEQPKTGTYHVNKLLKDPLKEKTCSNSNANTTNAKKGISSKSTAQHKYQKPVKVTPKSKTKRLNILSTPKSQFKVSEKVYSAYQSLKSPSREKRKIQSTNRNAVTSKIRAKKWPQTPTKTQKNKYPVKNKFMEQLVANYIGFFSGSENDDDSKNKLEDVINVVVHPKTEAVTVSSQSGLSFTSSNNLKPMMHVLSTSNHSTMQSIPFRVSFPVESPSPKVLVFDYLNSLNNVQLSPIDETKAHVSNSVKKEQTTCDFEHSHSNGIHNNQNYNNFELQTVNIQQKQVVARATSTQQDQRNRISKSHPVNKEEQVIEIHSIKNKSEIFLQDHYSSHSLTKITKDKTRIRSPSPKDRHLTSIEITPKPKTKMQNVSNSAKVKIKAPPPVEPPLHTHEPAHSMKPKNNNAKKSGQNALGLIIYGKGFSRNRGRKLATTKTAEQLISDITGEAKDDHEKNLPEDVNPDLNLKREISEISQSGVTFTLSKTINTTKDAMSIWNTDYRFPQQITKQDTLDWPPEQKGTTGSIKPDSDSGVNVVAQIDMLPFMGSQECEWETSPADTWSFRMLNGRLRLTARLAHRMHNLTRTRVRGDTPVLDISVTPALYDRVDLVASLCAHFACASLRHLVSRAIRGKFCASDIPPLLRRCAAVVRVALRWKRVMYEAKKRLAYTLDNYGNLSLKVANIPLRSVWDVTMHIGLESADATSVPCPRATSVCVLPVVSDVLVPAADVKRVLAHTPEDWGNVPSTIWRIYRLLKHKK